VHVLCVCVSTVACCGTFLCAHTLPLVPSAMISAYQQVRDNDHEGDRHAPGVVGEPFRGMFVCVRVQEVMTD
jgi:hypothetical protein